VSRYTQCVLGVFDHEGFSYGGCVRLAIRRDDEQARHALSLLRRVHHEGSRQLDGIIPAQGIRASQLHRVCDQWGCNLY
jgi:hypothetical protein